MTSFNCKNCFQGFSLDTNIKWVEFICPSCTASNYLDRFHKNSFGKINKNDISFTISEQISFDGEEYQLISIIVKKIQTHTKWVEYCFVNSKEKKLFLSECNGHWIKLVETDKKPIVFKPKSETKLKNNVFFESKNFQIFSKDHVETIYAIGLFDYYNATQRYELAEYIAPPFILSVEFRSENYEAYIGEHISEKELKKIKPNIYLPSKAGVGVVQPYQYPISKTASIYLYFAAFILTFFFAMTIIAKNRNVLSAQFDLDSSNSKELRSNSFELKGWASAPLSFELYSSNDNSWTSTTIELINEKTNESIFATKDMEYYHGYEDGESWSEGDIRQDFSICGIGSGKYHLIISSEKEKSDVSLRHINLKIKWDKLSFWNTGLALIGLAILAMINYYLAWNHDRKRWGDSEFDIYYVE